MGYKAACTAFCNRNAGILQAKEFADPTDDFNPRLFVQTDFIPRV
jgi:hypothetical protein